jgi:hypothetical protein
MQAGSRRAAARFSPLFHTKLKKVSMRLQLFEIHEQRWFPQFLRDQFVDGLQMILEVMSTYAPIAQLLRRRMEECGTERVVDLCSGAGGP